MNRTILHRRVELALALVLISVCAIPLAAQRKTSTGPRALGVLVIPKAPANAKKLPQPYLIPITLWFQNRYLDAQLYGARPEPMALDGGVVYETRRGGEALGLFTVDSVAQQENKRWLGGGTYQTMKEIEARAAARRERNKPPSEISKDEGPPRLRRSDSKPATTAPAPEPAPAPSASSASPSAPPASSTPAAPPPAQPAAKSEPAPAAKAPADDDDPDRPRLHRAPAGQPQQIAPAIKPGPTQLALPPKNTPAPPSAPQGVRVLPANAPEVLVAISDAKTSEPRPYDFSWSADEKTTWTKAAEQIANSAIANFLERRYRVQPPAEPARTPASPRSRTRAAAPPAPPAPEPLQDEVVRALDVQTDNYPELILTAERIAQVPGPDGGADQRTVFVTIVVKIDSLAVDRRNQFRPMFTYVTDDRHLDELPKLQLIDPVDADGDGVGELLFRETFSLADEQNPSAWGFQLFRVGVDRLEKLYDSEGKIE